MLASVSPTVLDAIRERPVLIAGILQTGDRFVADFTALAATADTKPTRAWFDTAVNGTEPLGYDEVTDGPAFALDVADVRAVALGLVEEGWAPVARAESAETDVDATARSLGAAAGWDPDEFSTYGQMLAGSWSPEFVHRLVRAVGAAGNWPDETIERVHTAVALPTIVPRGDGLAAFYAAAAKNGNAVGGRPPPIGRNRVPRNGVPPWARSTTRAGAFPSAILEPRCCPGYHQLQDREIHRRRRPVSPR